MHRLYDLAVRLAAFVLAFFPLALLAADDLTPLCDEFDNAATLSQWQRLYAIEGWGANQLDLQDINTTRPGFMVMIPYTSTWYDDYRGELTFKVVSGDFVVTAEVEVSNRSDSGAPASEFSLAGIMLRQPRNITPATWQPGGENYVFLSLGAGNQPGTFQFEVKSTVSSNSQPILVPAGTSHAVIQWARIGPYFIALRQVNGTWSVHRRYSRPDLASTLQAGMTVYTDYPTASSYSAFVQNSTVIDNGNPDLIAAYDFFRFSRPKLPPALEGVDLTNPMLVSDSDLLSFLGDHANPAPFLRHRAVRR